MLSTWPLLATVDHYDANGANADTRDRIVASTPQALLSSEDSSAPCRTFLATCLPERRAGRQSPARRRRPRRVHARLPPVACGVPVRASWQLGTRARRASIDTQLRACCRLGNAQRGPSPRDCECAPPGAVPSVSAFLLRVFAGVLPLPVGILRGSVAAPLSFPSSQAILAFTFVSGCSNASATDGAF